MAAWKRLEGGAGHGPPGTWNSSSPTTAIEQIYLELFDLYKSTYSHVQDGFKSLQSLLRRTNS